MTPPSPVGSSTPVQPVLPGQSMPPSFAPPPQGDPSGPDGYTNGKPTAPGNNLPRHPLFGKYDPKAADPAKAKKFCESGDKLMDKKNYAKAEEAYTKALAADPTNREATIGLAKALVHGKDQMGPFKAHEILSFYLTQHPEDHEMRSERLKLGAGILQALGENAKKFTPDEKSQLQPIIMGLSAGLRVDQAILIAGSSKEHLNQLKAQEEQLSTMHGATKERKLQIIMKTVASIQDMVAMTQLRFPDQKSAELVRTEIPKIVAETFGVLARFADADAEPEIKKMAPLFHAYHLMGTGKMDEARPLMETVRKQGYEAMGGGNEETGRNNFKKKLDDAKKLEGEINKLNHEIEESLKAGKADEAQKKAGEMKGKFDEAQKLFADVPQGFMDAYSFLDGIEKAETQLLKRSNLAVVAEWKKKINRDHASKVDEYTGTWSVAWRAIPYGIKGVASTVFSDGSISTPFDDINAETSRQRDLVSEVERKINRGEAKTIKEALTQIKDKGSAELKASAQAFLDSETDITVKPLIEYTSLVKPDEKLQETLLNSAKTLKGMPMGALKDHAATLYSVIGFHATDEKVRKAAQAEVDHDHLDRFVQEQTEDPKPKDPKTFTGVGASIKGTVYAGK